MTENTESDTDERDADMENQENDDVEADEQNQDTDDPADEGTQFSDVDHIGQLRGADLSDFLSHSATVIEIRHDGERVARLDTARGDIARPRYRGERLKFSLQARLSRFSVNTVATTQNDEGPVSDPQNADESNDEDTTNKNGYETDGKMVMSMDLGE